MYRLSQISYIFGKNLPLFEEASLQILMIDHDFLSDVVGSGTASNGPDVVGVPGDDGHGLHWKEIPWSLLMKEKGRYQKYQYICIYKNETPKNIKSSKSNKPDDLIIVTGRAEGAAGGGGYKDDEPGFSVVTWDAAADVLPKKDEAAMVTLGPGLLWPWEMCDA